MEDMKKRLFCILLAVSMIGSSLTINAAEQTDQTVIQTPASENSSDEMKEVQEEEKDGKDIPAAADDAPDIIPGGDEAPEATGEPVGEPTALPEETEAPATYPEEEPTAEPEATPEEVPSEVPEISPSPEPTATPGMTPLPGEELLTTAEEEELVGVRAEWSNGWIEDTGVVFTGEVTIGDGPGEQYENDTVGVKENAELTLDNCRLVVENNNFENLGTIIVKGQSVISDPDYTIMTTGRIILESGAVLTIDGNATFPNLAGGKDAFSNVSGGGTVIVTKNYIGEPSGATEGEGAFQVTNITVNKGITLCIEGKEVEEGEEEAENNLCAIVTDNGSKKIISSDLAWRLQGGGTVLFEKMNLEDASQRWTVANGTTLKMTPQTDGNVEYVFRDLIVEAGAAVEVAGNFSHHSGTVIINGGAVHVGGSYTLACNGGAAEYNSGILEMNNEAGTLTIDGDFIKASQASNYCAAGTISVGGNINLTDTDTVFNGGDSFKLILSGTNVHKIMSVNAANMLNLSLENNPIIDIQDPVKLAIASDGSVTPAGGTFVSTGELKLNGHNIMVNGDVEASHRIELGTGGRLNVTGNYTQISDYLKIGDAIAGGGAMIVGGDFRLQGKGADGNYCAGDGGLIMENPLDSIVIGGNFILESVNASYHSFWGTMTVKGDIEQKYVENTDPEITKDGSRFYGNKDFKLILAGDSSQTISLESKTGRLNNLELQNEDITVKGYLDAQLISDGVIKLPEDGMLEITRLSLQNHKLDIKGSTDSVVKASGSVDLGGLDGHLLIPGDYIQSSGSLRIGEGIMEIGGDLLLLDRDDDGNDITGDGRLAMAEEEGYLVVKGDITMQSTQNSNLSKGTIVLSGDLIQKAGEDGSGTGSITASESHKTVLAGDGPQNVTLENEKSGLGTVQLTKDQSNYEFDPSEVSKKVTTGEVPDPRPSSQPSPSAQPTAAPSSAPTPSSAPSSAPQPTPSSKPSDWLFSDVPTDEGSWRYDSIKYVYERGIMNGISGTDRFAPDEPLTRGMFATVLYRMAGEPDVAFENRFSDVQDGRYYSKAIIWAYSRGIVQGYGGGGIFGTEEYITREQIAKMLSEFGQGQGYSLDERADLNEFPDNSDVSGWAVDYMKWAAGSGMINGKNIDGVHYLDPRGNATRVECAAMLTRFMKRYM